jgi:hypothetical protein
MTEKANAVTRGESLRPREHLQAYTITIEPDDLRGRTFLLANHYGELLVRDIVRAHGQYVAADPRDLIEVLSHATTSTATSS